MMTVEKANETMANYNEIIRLAIPIANRLAKIKGYDNEFDSSELDYCAGEIDCEWDEYIGCGDYDSHIMSFPLEYLFDDDFIVKAEEEQRLEDERSKKAYEERQAAQKKANDEREKAKYLKLKEKWG